HNNHAQHRAGPAAAAKTPADMRCDHDLLSACQPRAGLVDLRACGSAADAHHGSRRNSARPPPVTCSAVAGSLLHSPAARWPSRHGPAGRRGRPGQPARRPAKRLDLGGGLHGRGSSGAGNLGRWEMLTVEYPLVPPPAWGSVWKIGLLDPLAAKGRGCASRMSAWTGYPARFVLLRCLIWTAVPVFIEGSSGWG